MTRRALALMLGATLLVAACSRAEDIPTVADGSGTSASGTSDPFAMPTEAPATDSVDPNATPSPFASTEPGPVPAHNGTILPNNFYRYIGERLFGKWLFSPVALATVGDRLLVGDAQRHTDPFGAYSAVLEFDGRGADAVTPQGGLYTQLDPATPTSRLAPSLRAIAASNQVVVAMNDWGVYGFMRDTRYSLNLGKPLTGPGQDLAVSGNSLYVAQNGRINAFSLISLGSDAATAAITVNAVGLGADAQGHLLVATATQVSRYAGGKAELTFDGKGSDGAGPGFEALQDVAADPRNGDLYALDRHAVLRFDASGRFLSRFGQGLLQGARSIAVGQSGDVYVSDETAKKVLQFEPSR